MSLEGSFADRKFAQFDRSRAHRETEQRYSFGEYLEKVSSYSHNGQSYTLPVTTYGSSKQEPIGVDFLGLTEGAFKQNPVVFAAIAKRAGLLSDARFKFRGLTDGKMFGTPALAPLERPGVNQTTGEMIYRAEQDESLAGNYYATNRFGGVTRLFPHLVDILIDGDEDDPQLDPGARVVGYLYWPKGRGSGYGAQKPMVFAPEEIVHWSPVPDPAARFRGMSWLQPIVIEIQSDKAATEHKAKFFENGATVNLAVVAPDFVKNLTQLEEFRDKMNLGHRGTANAYKTLFLAAGADVKTIGADLKQIDFKATQGAGETRIAVASEVPAPLLNISEGLSGSSLNAGNLGVARRMFADSWARPKWRSLCAAFAKFVVVPPGAELWTDLSDVAFLREDEKDAAQIFFTEAQAARQLTDGGYEPPSVIAATAARDMTLLVHSGLLSVQLLPPGTEAKPAPPKET